MKKILKIIAIIIVVLIVVGLIFFALYYARVQKLATLSAVVMEVHENSLSVMEIKDRAASNSLYTVSFAQEENIGFN